MWDRSKDLEVRPLNKRHCTAIMAQHPYKKEIPSITQGYGLYVVGNDQLVAAVSYHTPGSAPLRKSVCGPENDCNVFELNRLWWDASVVTPGEVAGLVLNSVGRVPKEIMVMFLGQEEGEFGMRVCSSISNLFYTGLSEPRTDRVIAGDLRDLHPLTMADQYPGQRLTEAYGPTMCSRRRPRKHRFFLFNCTCDRLQSIRASWNWKVYGPKPPPWADQSNPLSGL
jgi:hypothetical protein